MCAVLLLSSETQCNSGRVRACREGTGRKVGEGHLAAASAGRRGLRLASRGDSCQPRARHRPDRLLARPHSDQLDRHCNCSIHTY